MKKIFFISSTCIVFVVSCSDSKEQTISETVVHTPDTVTLRTISVDIKMKYKEGSPGFIVSRHIEPIKSELEKMDDSVKYSDIVYEDFCWITLRFFNEKNEQEILTRVTDKMDSLKEFYPDSTYSRIITLTKE